MDYQQNVKELYEMQARHEPEYLNQTKRDKTMTEESLAFLEAINLNQVGDSNARLPRTVAGKVSGLARQLNKAIENAFSEHDPNWMMFK